MWQGDIKEFRDILKTVWDGATSLNVTLVGGAVGGQTIKQGDPNADATKPWGAQLSNGTVFIPLPTALTGGGGLKAGLVDELPAGTQLIGSTDLSIGGTKADGTHPLPIRARDPIAPVTHRASAVLLGSGAWSSGTPYAIPAGLKRVGFLVTYTGGAGGAVQYRVRKGTASGTLASEQVLDGSPSPAGTEAAQESYDATYKRPVTDTAPTSFLVDVDVEGGWTHVILDLAEFGNTGSPGTAAVTLVGSY